MLNKEIFSSRLKKLYLKNHKSVPEIAKLLKCSDSRINYWLIKHHISKRTISEAIYIKHNPRGDPFKFHLPKNLKEAILFGLGVGLYWGEGNRANKNLVKIGNTDPALLKIFIQFLIEISNIKKSDLKFHLQIFSDINIKEAVKFWMKELGIKKKQMYKTTITKTGAIGTYRKKSKYGVLTVYYANTKLRNILVNLCSAEIAQLAEHAHGKRKVLGSTPSLGSMGWVAK